MAQKYVPAALRRLVRERASGRCEYCLAAEQLTYGSHWVDHVIAEKHGGQTAEENLALSCKLCNQRKGTDLSSIDPNTNELTPLFNPRRDAWADHFQWAGALVEARTAVGRVTLRLLQLNHPHRVAEREQLMKLRQPPAS